MVRRVGGVCLRLPQVNFKSEVKTYFSLLYQKVCCTKLTFETQFKILLSCRCFTSKMKLFSKLINGFQPLTILQIPHLRCLTEF